MAIVAALAVACAGEPARPRVNVVPGDPVADESAPPPPLPPDPVEAACAWRERDARMTRWMGVAGGFAVAGALTVGVGFWIGGDAGAQIIGIAGGVPMMAIGGIALAVLGTQRAEHRRKRRVRPGTTAHAELAPGGLRVRF